MIPVKVQSSRPLVATTFGVLGVLALCGASGASILDAREVALAVESTMTDYDAANIANAFGSGVTSDFTYTSTYFAGGWSGTMTGTHNGHNVSVGYNGSVVPTGGPGAESYSVSFSRTWNVDGSTSVGSGFASFQERVARSERGDCAPPDPHIIDFGMFDAPGANLPVDLGDVQWNGSIFPSFEQMFMDATGQLVNGGQPGFNQVKGDFWLDRFPKTYTSQIWLLSYPPKLAGTNQGFTNMPMFGGGGSNFQHILVPTPGAAALAGLSGLLLAMRRRSA